MSIYLSVQRPAHPASCPSCFLSVLSVLPVLRPLPSNVASMMSSSRNDAWCRVHVVITVLPAAARPWREIRHGERAG